MDYTDLAATALELITDAGKPITLKRTTGATLTPGTGVKTGGTPVTFSGSAVEIQFERSILAQGLVKAGSKRLLVVGIPQPEQASDNLTVDGRDWQIQKVLPLSPGATVLLYELWVT